MSIGMEQKVRMKQDNKKEIELSAAMQALLVFAVKVQGILDIPVETLAERLSEPTGRRPMRGLTEEEQKLLAEYCEKWGAKNFLKG